jgi:hypothetical protein
MGPVVEIVYVLAGRQCGFGCLVVDSSQSCVGGGGVPEGADKDVQTPKGCVFLGAVGGGGRLAGQVTGVSELKLEGKGKRVISGGVEDLMLGVRKEGVFEVSGTRNEEVGVDAEHFHVVSFANSDGEIVRAETAKVVSNVETIVSMEWVYKLNSSIF